MVEELLDKKGIPYSYQGKDIVVRCLNPEHPDRNPSLRIDKVTGLGHCFSCGFKLNLFRYFAEPANSVKAKVALVKEKITTIYSDVYGLEVPKGAQPYPREFRDIPVEVLRKFGAFKHKDYQDRIVFPLRDIQGKIRAFVARTEPHSRDLPRYKISPPGASLPLFPEKLNEKNSTLFLVEGPFDMLNLYAKGIHNVAAMLGTQGLGSLKQGLRKDKVHLLKLQGVSRLVLLMDGDEAGRKAAEILEPMLKAADFEVISVDLAEGDDPGSLDQDTVNQLIKFYDENCSN